MAAASRAYQQGNYLEAEKQLIAALREAEGFGPKNLRMKQHGGGAPGRLDEIEPLAVNETGQPKNDFGENDADGQSHRLQNQKRQRRAASRLPPDTGSQSS